jgi:hypothetical protein
MLLDMMRMVLVIGLCISLLNLPLLAAARVLGSGWFAPQLFYSQTARVFRIAPPDS